MKAIINSVILLPDREIRGQALLYDEKLTGIGALPEDCDEIIDARGAYAAPGLIDTHIHGYRGADASDGDREALVRMAEQMAENGVTAFFPTTMTIHRDRLETALDSIRKGMAATREKTFRGAEIIGCHAEGPFINPNRKGAQAEEAILPPDAEMILEHQDVIRLMTYAPEMPGAEKMAGRILSGSRIRLSIGHTDAEYSTVMQALDLGADRFTHLFNAMPPMYHRKPGPVGAALTTDAWAEVIADGVHVHPSLFPLLHRAKGNRLVLITDCLRSGGMPDGEYFLGGQRFIRSGPECRLADGTIAGSVLAMNEAVRRFREYAGVPTYEAVRAASLNAAESAGIGTKKGSLEPGKDADIILMDENCGILRTIREGRTVYRRPDESA